MTNENTSAKPKAMNKNQLKQALAEATGISSKQAGDVLEALANIAVSEVNSNGGFTIPDLCKITKSHKPATPEKTMLSPLTKEQITVKAKPAKNVVKVKPVKALKDAIA